MLGLPQSKKKLRLNRIDFETGVLPFMGRRDGGQTLRTTANPLRPLPTRGIELYGFQFRRSLFRPFWEWNFPAGKLHILL